jgi:hypothetical protein
LSEPVCFFDGEPRLFRVGLRRLLLHHSSRARGFCFGLLLASVPLLNSLNNGALFAPCG